MSFIENIDPFILQLVIVPAIVIGLGVLVSVLTNKIFIGPLITLISNLLFEVWHSKYYYHYPDISFSSWNIILPGYSLIISATIVLYKKTNRKNCITSILISSPYCRPGYNKEPTEISS